MTVVPQKYLANYCVRNFGMQPQLATITYPSPFFRGYNSMPSRRTAGFLIVLALLSTAFGQRRDLDQAKPAGSGTVIYSGEGAILVKVPSGWVTNERNGRVLGIQCTFYPAHSSWINAPSIMYPDIATKGPGRTSAQELMEKDLKGLRAIYPKITIARAEDLPTAERGSRPKSGISMDSTTALLTQQLMLTSRASLLYWCSIPRQRKHSTIRSHYSVSS